MRSVQRQQTRQLLDPDTGRRQEKTVHKNPYHDRLYLFALNLVSGARKLCCKELQVFQTRACGELTLWHGLIRLDTWLVLLVCVSVGRD